MTSRNPLRRLAEQVVLTGMRPPILPTLLQYRPNREVVDLTGKRVLITGASSGIGEAAAAQLARRGAVVVVVARRSDLLEGVVERIRADGGQASAHVCDTVECLPPLGAGTRAAGASGRGGSMRAAMRSVNPSATSCATGAKFAGSFGL